MAAASLPRPDPCWFSTTKRLPDAAGGEPYCAREAGPSGLSGGCETNELETALAALFPFAVVPALRVLQILLILVFCGDHRMKRAMRESDRLLAWTQAAEHFEQGSGTMITNWRYPTGLFRIWWTPDDLISAAPTSLPKSWDEAMDSTDERLSTFAETLFKRYLQEQDGTAKMVRKPLLSGVIAPEKPLSVQFPRARILSLVEFGPQYYVHQGETDP